MVEADDSDKACFCGGLAKFSEMLISVEALLCEAQGQDREANFKKATGVTLSPADFTTAPPVTTKAATTAATTTSSGCAKTFRNLGGNKDL